MGLALALKQLPRTQNKVEGASQVLHVSSVSSAGINFIHYMNLPEQFSTFESACRLLTGMKPESDFYL